VGTYPWFLTVRRRPVSTPQPAHRPLPTPLAPRTLPRTLCSRETREHSITHGERNVTIPSPPIASLPAPVVGFAVELSRFLAAASLGRRGSRCPATAPRSPRSMRRLRLRLLLKLAARAQDGSADICVLRELYAGGSTSRGQGWGLGSIWAWSHDAPRDQRHTEFALRRLLEDSPRRLISESVSEKRANA
jgi:hypothetical protein